MKTKPVLIGPHPLNETSPVGGYASFQCKVKSQVQPHIQVNFLFCCNNCFVPHPPQLQAIVKKYA